MRRAAKRAAPEETDSLERLSRGQELDTEGKVFERKFKFPEVR
jgi:hypothetical protein